MSSVHIHVHAGKTRDAKVQPATLQEAIRKTEAILAVLRSPKILEEDMEDFREGVKGLTAAYNWFK